MSAGNHTCAWCGRQWFDTALRAVSPMFCTPECSDAWHDAHLAEKARAGYLTRQDVVDKALKRAGLIPMPRATPMRGDN